jgi:Rrf2 family protein
MKLITRDTDYALRAICAIAKGKKEVVSVSQLVRQLRMPRPFLRKLLQRLNKEGILTSYKGQGGGFMLARPARKIYLIDLINIFHGQFQLNECLFKKTNCPQTRTCALRKRIGLIEQHVISELKKITIASLLRQS